MLARFVNLTIGVKVLSVPATLVAMLLGLAAYAFLLLGTNEEKVRVLSTGIAQHASTLLEFQIEAQRTISVLYRLTSTAANESDDEKIVKMGKAVAGGLDRLSANFAGVKAAVVGAGLPQDKVDALDASFVAYVKAAKFAADMVTVESSAALTFMTGAEGKFKDVETLLDEVSGTLAQRRDGMLASIYSDMSTGRSLFVAISLAIAALALAVSFLVSRLISRPIVDMTSTLARIAEKDYSSIVPALGQTDEIGRMAQAVNVLKRRPAR
jgi:methyl-accepting chemotaxis protein